MLFEAFNAARATEHPDDASVRAYAEQAKHLIAINFQNRQWMRRMPEAGLEPADVAADMLSFAVTRIHRFRLDSPCEKVLLKQLNRAFFNLAASATRGKPRPMAATNLSREGFAFDQRVGTWLPALSAVRERLRLAEEELARGLTGDIFAILKLNRLLRRHLFGRGAFTPYDQLPERLLQNVEREQYNVLVPRIRRFLAAL